MNTGGRKLAFTHGHLPRLVQEAMQTGADYLLHGHTHEVRDERICGVRVINPGALFRAARYTAALLDPEADRLEFIEIVPVRR
jgi:predicted phosphodiesterase